MIADAEAGEFDVLLCYETSRFARNVADPGGNAPPGFARVRERQLLAPVEGPDLDRLYADDVDTRPAINPGRVDPVNRVRDVVCDENPRVLLGRKRGPLPVAFEDRLPLGHVVGNDAGDAYPVATPWEAHHRTSQSP